MKHLNRHVREAVCQKWYHLGIDILDDHDILELDTIEAQHPSDYDESCKKMFNLWLAR